MQPSTAKPTGSEKKFDRAKEEAFSNEGAPPPGQVSSLDDAAEVESGKEEPDAKTTGVTSLPKADSPCTTEPVAPAVEGTPKSRASLFGLTRTGGL
jgi:hypothetical protein